MARAPEIELFTQYITAQANGLTGKLLSQAAAMQAKTARDALIAAGRASPKFTTFVDGTINGKEETVEHSIVYEFIYIQDAVDLALTELKRLSPFGPKKSPGKRTQPGAADGRHYRDSFAIAVDGRIESANNFDSSKLANANTVTIFNEQPYGRKVDTQRIGSEKTGKGFQKLSFRNETGQTPTDFFKTVVATVNARFGNSVNVSRVYTVNVPNHYIRTTGTPPGRMTEYPAIVISSRAG